MLRYLLPDIWKMGSYFRITTIWKRQCLNSYNYVEQVICDPLIENWIYSLHHEVCHRTLKKNILIYNKNKLSTFRQSLSYHQKLASSSSLINRYIQFYFTTKDECATPLWIIPMPLIRCFVATLHRIYIFVEVVSSVNCVCVFM